MRDPSANADADALHEEAGGPLDRVRLDDRELDLVRGDVRLDDGRVFHLTSREAALLAWLIRRPSRVVARDTLLVEVWGYDERVVSRTVDTTVRRVRAKIERDATHPRHLLTEFGAGYRWEPSVARPVEAVEPPARRTNHADRVAPLLGRGSLLAEVVAAVHAGPLITLHGTAGVGKTRLAREVIAQWPHDAWFVDLCPVRDLAGAYAAAARAIELPLPSDRSAARAIGEALDARPHTLLVLDNAEHINAIVATLVQELRPHAPTARLLVTSRDRLRLGDERVLPVAPLALPDAVALFLRHAAQFGRPVLPDDRPLIEDIARRLDALPLAVELAAARTRVLPPARLLERLSDRLSVLGGGASDGPTHQATLRDALDWSWDLLDPVERRLLTQISAFQGRFDLDAVEQIVDPDLGDPLAPLERLIDQSLVTVHPDGELSLLQNIREWAAAKLPADDPTRTRYRTQGLARAIALGRRARGWTALTAMRDLDSGLDDLRSAIDASWDLDPEGAAEAVLAVDRLLHERGPADLHLALLDRGLAALPPERPAAIRLLGARGALARSVGQAESAATDLARARDLAVAHDPSSLPSLEALLANTFVDQADFEAAEKSALAAVGGARDRADPLAEAAALHALGRVWVARGQLDTALPVYRDALGAALRSGDPLIEATCRGNLGNVLVHVGLLEEASRHFTRGLDLHRRSGARRRVATLQLSLGNLALAGGDPRAAASAYREASQAYVALGLPLEAAMAQSNLGCAHLDDGAWSDADDALTQAFEGHLRLGKPERLVAIATGNLGRLRQCQGRTREAIDLLGTSGAALERLGDVRSGAWFVAQHASALAEAHRLAEARDQLARIAERVPQLSDPSLATWVRTCEGFLRWRTTGDSGDREALLTHLEAALGPDAPERRSAHLRVALRRLLHVASGVV